MKIVYLITGSGGSFYCGNCYRDMIYLRAIRMADDITATAIPLYLPPERTNIEKGLDKNVFFGAVSMYMREKIPFLKNMPSFLEKVFDSGPMLRMAASKAGSTRPEGLEEMTLNMIRGGTSFPEKEIERLITYLLKDGKPDIIHLSNALIIGLARQLKKRMDVKVVCSLLNEDDWIDEMNDQYQKKSWELMAQQAEHVDAFVTPSNYYKNHFISKTGISGNNIHVIPIGIDSEGIDSTQRKSNYPALGYFCRVNSQNGFDRLIDAFILLKKENTLPGLTLHVSGGYTNDDKPFIDTQLKKIKAKGLDSSVIMHPEFQSISKEEFFSNINIMSVPVRKHDGYGLYILEANLAGVPVVQPATGAFPEIIEKTSGGIVYSPDTIEELANALVKLFSDNALREELGRSGKEKVAEELNLEKMSVGLSNVYSLVSSVKI